MIAEIKNVVESLNTVINIKLFFREGTNVLQILFSEIAEFLISQQDNGTMEHIRIIFILLYRTNVISISVIK